jgi:hypothetical protein
MHHRHLAVLALGFALGASAAELPKLRAGLWELTTASSKAQEQPPPMKSCVDDATQQEMMNFGQGVQRQMCSRYDVRNEGGKIVAETDCKLGPTRMTSRSVTTFSGSSSYRTEVRATYDPPLAGQKEATLTMEGRHLGACPADMKPGDIEVAGKRMNLRDMRGAMGKGAK